MAVLERRQDELNDLLTHHTEPHTYIHPNLAEVYRQKVADLHLALQDDSIKDDAIGAITESCVRR